MITVNMMIMITERIHHRRRRPRRSAIAPDFFGTSAVAESSRVLSCPAAGRGTANHAVSTTQPKHKTMMIICRAFVRVDRSLDRAQFDRPVGRRWRTQFAPVHQLNYERRSKSQQRDVAQRPDELRGSPHGVQ